MKPFLAIFALALFAIPAHADSWQVNAYVDFLVNGQQYDFTYSYDVCVAPDGSETGTNLAYSVDNGSWTLAVGASDLYFNLVDGPIFFSSAQEGSSDALRTGSIFLDQEMFGPQGPTGQNIGFDWTVTQVPEPATLYLLALALPALALKRKAAPTHVAQTVDAAASYPTRLFPKSSTKGETMSNEQFLALLAAIIFAGADDNQHGAGYSAAKAVELAREILREAKNESAEVSA